MLNISLDKLLSQQRSQALYFITALNLIFTEIEESAMNTRRHYDPVEVQRIVDLYYIIEMQFVIEKLMFAYHEARGTTGLNYSEAA